VIVLMRWRIAGVDCIDFVSLMADYDGEYGIFLRDCVALAKHRSWLGDARSHLSIHSECECERMVWTLYNGALTLCDCAAADPNYIQVALLDGSPFVRATAFVAFWSVRGEVRGPNVVSPHSDKTNVPRLLHEIVVQCTRDGPLERQLLCDELSNLSKSVRMLSEIRGWQDNDESSTGARYTCTQLFKAICALCLDGIGRGVRGPVETAALDAIVALLTYCPCIAGDREQGLSLWCKAYRLLTCSDMSRGDYVEALAVGATHLSLCSVPKASPFDIGDVMEFTGLAMRGSSIFGSRVHTSNERRTLAIAALLPVCASLPAAYAPPQLRVELMPNAMGLASAFAAATRRCAHRITARGARGRAAPQRRKNQNSDAGIQVVLAIAQRWSQESPERLRECLYDLAHLPCLEQWVADGDTTLQYRWHGRHALELFSMVGGAADCLLPPNRHDAIAGQLVHWFEDGTLKPHGRDEVVAALEAHMRRVKDVRRFVDGFGDWSSLCDWLSKIVLPFFADHLAWKKVLPPRRTARDSTTSSQDSELGERKPTAAQINRHRAEQRNKLLVALAAVLSPLAEWCFRFRNSISNTSPIAPLLSFVSSQWFLNAGDEKVARFHRHFAFLATCASLEQNLLLHPPCNACPAHRPSSELLFPEDVYGMGHMVEADTANSSPLQRKDQLAADVLDALTGSAGRVDDEGVTQCNDEDLDDLLAPLTLEFCTSLRTLLMRDINAFTPASSGGPPEARFPTHLALLLLELHRHTVFARGALHTAAMVDECAACFAKAPPFVSSALRSLQGSVRRRCRSARDETLLEGESALRRSAREEPRRDALKL
jgi:hypothetical protein